MKKISDMILEEIKNNNSGTYVGLKFDTGSEDSIKNFLNANDIFNDVDKSEYHITLAYSRKNVTAYANNYIFHFPILVRHSGWKIFNGKNGSNCLVMTIKSPDLKYHYKKFISFGATTDYPMYIPHITVSYDYKGDKLPTAIMQESLTLTHADIQKLNEE